MKHILGMNFEDNNCPDFGSIAFDREGNLILLGADIHKLNNLLTRAICVGTYNVPTFYFQSGDMAYAVDTSRLFMYDASTDAWIEQEF